MVGQCRKKVPVNNFEWIEDTPQSNEDFIKSFLEVVFQYPKNLHELHNDLPFLPERIESEKIENLVTNLHHKIEYVIPTI